MGNKSEVYIWCVCKVLLSRWLQNWRQNNFSTISFKEKKERLAEERGTVTLEEGIRETEDREGGVGEGAEGAISFRPSPVSSKCAGCWVTVVHLEIIGR